MSRRRRRASGSRRASGGPRVAFVGIGAATIVALALAAWWLARPRPQPDVLLVTLDTTRADHLGCYGAAFAATPTIDALAARGVRFATAVAHTPLTGPSHASLLTGLVPPRHGVRDNGLVLPAGVATLAERFAGAGYATAAFVSGFPLDRRFGLSRGFARYDDRLPRGDDPGRAAYVERRADMTTDAALAWLVENGGQTWPPRFAWVHYFDPHAPYDAGGELGARFRERPYDGEIAFADAQLGRLLDALEAQGRLARTLVLVTADHGESLGEHGEDTHGVFIYDATLRVPFVLAGPGVPAGGVSPVVARGVDVAPTLADLAGLPPLADVDGRSLRRALAGRALEDAPAYVEALFSARHFGFAPLHGWRTVRLKLIEAPTPELYALDADPRERDNVYAARSGEAAPLHAALEQVLKAQVREAEADPAAAERLRALGYVGAAGEAPASGRDPKDAIELIRRVEAGLAAVWADPQRAVRELTAALEADPRLPIAWRQRAIAHARLGRSAETLADLEQLARLGPLDAEEQALLGEALRRLGRAAAATAAFQRSLALAPGQPDALQGLGDLALARGDVAAAARFYAQALEAAPVNVGALLRLGTAELRAGRVEAGIERFRAAVEADPQHAEALLHLAGALAKAGRAGEAVPFFERAIAAGLDTPVAWNGLGFARLEAGDAARGLEALRASLERDPRQPDVARVVAALEAGAGARSGSGPR